MGPYLAQPITDKHTAKNESQKTKLRCSFCEMQGTFSQMKDGGGICKMPQSVRLISETATLCLLSLMGMEVDNRNNLGVEVSKYV